MGEDQGGDTVYRKPRATTSEGLEKPPFRSPPRAAGGCRETSPMPRIAFGSAPPRRGAEAIYMGLYPCRLVLALGGVTEYPPHQNTIIGSIRQLCQIARKPAARELNLLETLCRASRFIWGQLKSDISSRFI